MTALDRFRDALTAHDCNPRGTAAKCPAHEDNHASLSFGPAKDFNGVVVKCHAGCHLDNILDAFGLTISDLFDEPRQAKQGRAVVAEYPYFDEAGTVLHVKVRFWPKDFRQYVPLPDGGKQWNLNRIRRVLFHLPQLLAAKGRAGIIYLAEGEEDVLALERVGVAATTWTEGAWQPGDRAKWRTEYSQTLAGMHVIIVRDRDTAGRHTAKDIASHLAQHAASIKIVEAAEGKDARDHLNAGHNVDELVPVTDDEATTDQRIAQLADLLTQLRTWQDLPDPVHVIAALAAAATRNLDGEPCWLLLVAPPSSGKTETARLLDEIVDARINEVTAAGLLSWSKGKAKTVKPTGILARIGKQALVTFGDLSSLLATSDRGGRDQVFGLLRRAYDGHVTRDIAPPNGADTDQQLEWSGRLTVVACVTGAIDRYAAHADQLGPRWLQVRIAERTTEQKRRAARLARRSDLAAHRATARKGVAELLTQLPDNLPDLSDEIADDIEDAALVTTWGRAAVPRNGYGRREIEDVPVIEEPMRLVQQLGGIARGILALGLPTTAAAAIARRLALDSMPATRHAVLGALSTGEVLSTSACARAANLDRKVCRMALEELAAIGVVENDRSDEEDDPVGVVNWCLSGDDGTLVVSVFEAHRASGWEWDETWVYTSTSPPIKEEESSSTKREPTLRPTPDLTFRC